MKTTETSIIYLVKSRWVDYDGWGKSDPRLRKAFFNKEAAKQYMFEETGDENALKYGQASVGGSGDHYSWSIEELEVE